MENRILVKCPQCGSAISEKKRRCQNCGLSVASMLKMAGSQPASAPPIERPLEAAAQPAVPDWRREASEKLKAYGERKRTLLTPPSPIKETGNESSAAQTQASFVAEHHQPPVTDSPRPQPLRSRAPQTASSPPVQPNHLSAPRAEIWNTDFEELKRNVETEEDPSSQADVFLGRRTISTVIDNTIIIVLYLAVVFLFAYFFSLDFVAFVRSSWLSFGGVFFLAHCLYYVYFYSTSRQTPGQVFVALEVRDPNSSRIVLGKVLIRWSAMVILNLLNLLPILFKKNYLLSDKLSGTEIRSF